MPWKEKGKNSVAFFGYRLSVIGYRYLVIGNRKIYFLALQHLLLVAKR